MATRPTAVRAAMPTGMRTGRFRSSQLRLALCVALAGGHGSSPPYAQLQPQCGALIAGDACQPAAKDETIGSNLTGTGCVAACSNRSSGTAGCCWYGPSDRSCQWNAGGRAAPAGGPTHRSAVDCGRQPPPPPPPPPLPPWPPGLTFAESIERLKHEVMTLSADQITSRLEMLRLTAPPPRSRAAKKIDHFVVMFLENRAFDHMLGCLASDIPGVDGIDPTGGHRIPTATGHTGADGYMLTTGIKWCSGGGDLAVPNLFGAGNDGGHCPVIPRGWSDQRAVAACEAACSNRTACVGFNLDFNESHFAGARECCFRTGNVASKPKCPPPPYPCNARCYEKPAPPTTVNCGTAEYICGSDSSWSYDQIWRPKIRPDANPSRYPYGGDGNQSDVYSWANGKLGCKRCAGGKLFNKTQLPIKSALAHDFRIFNRYYSSVPSASTPNHLFAQSGEKAHMHTHLTSTHTHTPRLSLLPFLQL